MSGFKLLPTALESLFVFVCLLMLVGEILSQQNGVKVVVEEDSDAVLPCSPSTKENITGKLFDWKKDGQEVFLYDSGIHYNNGHGSPDLQFKGRVSHFQDQLMNGNASIKIQNVKMADSGNYSCIFPRLQPRETFTIQLVVGASKPIITILDATKDWSLLQCEVRGASPKPKVEWQDSSGNILPAEERQVSERGGRYYVTINTTVTKNDHYRCVVTQEEISHQTSAETFVFINVNPSTKEVIGLLFGGIVIGAVVLAVVQALLVAKKRITVTCNQDYFLWKIHDCIKTTILDFRLWKKLSRHENEQLQSAAEGQSSDVTDGSGLDSQDEGLIGNARNSQRGETSSRN